MAMTRMSFPQTTDKKVKPDRQRPAKQKPRPQPKMNKPNQRGR